MKPVKPYGSRWQRVRAVILERDQHRCQINGNNCTGHATEVDHVVPWREGGAPYDPANLRASCKQCNVGRANSRRSELAELALRDKTVPPPSRPW